MLSHRGAIYAGRRKIDLVLVAVPIGNRLEELVDYFGDGACGLTLVREVSCLCGPK